MSTSPRRTGPATVPPRAWAGVVRAPAGNDATGLRTTRRSSLPSTVPPGLVGGGHEVTTRRRPGGHGVQGEGHRPGEQPGGHSRRRHPTARRSSRRARSIPPEALAGTVTRPAGSWQVEREPLAVGRVPAAAVRLRPGQRTERVDEELADPLDVRGEDAQHLLVGDALTVLEPGVQVGHERDRGVAEAELTGERAPRGPRSCRRPTSPARRARATRHGWRTAAR